MYNEHGYGWMGGGFFGFPVGILLIIVLIGVLFYFISKKNSGAGESVLDILKKRYARGDITKEEYEKMKQELL